MKKLWLSILCLTAGSLTIGSLTTGCAGSVGAPVRYYLIDPMELSSLRESGAPIAVEIIDLSIPQYLEKFQIASRRGSNELSLSDGNQWGENLRKNLTRTMAQNLSRLLGTVDVGTPINRSLSAPDYRVRVYIEQFERGEDGLVRLSARWQVTGSADDNALVPEGLELVSNRASSSSDYGDTVKLMRRLFGRLSERIAESIVTHEMGHVEESGD